MLYRKDYSILGFGCMRFSKSYEDVNEQIMHAIDKGVNYFDTAYIYRGSEATLGKVLKENNCRDKIKIATKLPHYMVKTRSDMDRIFETQLERLQTDYIDNYLIHMLPDTQVLDRLKRIGIEEWFEEKKKSGQIRNVGFSFHGNSLTFLKILEAYDWDFCQIQYNYMDENSQGGKAGLQAAYQKDIPVIVMGPLRGGNLADGLPSKAKKIFQLTGRSPAEWAMRWIYAQKEVSCVLSGMNSMEMLDENIRIAEKDRVFRPEDFTMIKDVKEAIDANKKVGCTTCGYCMPCPVGVDIPGSFRCYNVSYSDGFFKGFKEYLMCTTFKAERQTASLCIKCGRCEPKCPQSIKISEDLVKVKKRFENPIYKVIALISKRFFRG